MLPVRPAPLWISSAISRMPWRSQRSRSRTHEILRRDVEAAFALHGLEDDGGDAVRRDVALEDHRQRVETESSTVTPCSAFGNGA